MIDLSLYSDKQIRQVYQSIALRTSLLLLKHIFNSQQLRVNFFTIFDMLPDLLAEKEGQQFFKRILLYLFYGSELEEDYIIDSFQKLSITGGNIAMSTAEKLIKRGKQEGKKETVLKMIEQGFKDETIAKITELPVSEIRKLRK